MKFRLPKWYVSFNNKLMKHRLLLAVLIGLVGVGFLLVRFGIVRKTAAEEMDAARAVFNLKNFGFDASKSVDATWWKV